MRKPLLASKCAVPVRRKASWVSVNSLPRSPKTRAARSARSAPAARGKPAANAARCAVQRGERNVVDARKQRGSAGMRNRKFSQRLLGPAVPRPVELPRIVRRQRALQQSRQPHDSPCREVGSLLPDRHAQFPGYILPAGSSKHTKRRGLELHLGRSVLPVRGRGQHGGFIDTLFDHRQRASSPANRAM